MLMNEQLVALRQLVSVDHAPGTHINTGDPCTVYSRGKRVLWLPEDDATEVVLQDGSEGEGQWWVAAPEGEAWTVQRDYWDEEADETAEATVFSGSRDEVLAFIVARFMD